MSKKDKHLNKGATPMGGQPNMNHGRPDPTLGIRQPDNRQQHSGFKPGANQHQPGAQQQSGFNKPGATQQKQGWGGHNSGQRDPHDKRK